MSQRFCVLLSLLLVAGKRIASSRLIFPNEPLPASGMRVIALGTGVPSLTKLQYCTGYLIQLGNGDQFIFDLGDGAFINLQQVSESWGTAKVFLSHLHSDHIADLVQLLSLGVNHGRNGNQLHIYGPSGPTQNTGTQAMVKGLNMFTGWDRMARARVALPTATLDAEKGHPVDYDTAQDPTWKDNYAVAHEFEYSTENQVVYSSNGVVIISTPVSHYFTPGCVAYRLEWNNLTFTYSGDTRPVPALIDLAGGSDLFLQEALGAVDYQHLDTLTDTARNIINSHTTPTEAGQLFEAVKPRFGVITHVDINGLSYPVVSAQVGAAYPGGAFTIATDLAVFDVTQHEVRYRKMAVPQETWGYTFSAPPAPPEDLSAATADDAALPYC